MLHATNLVPAVLSGVSVVAASAVAVAAFTQKCATQATNAADTIAAVLLRVLGMQVHVSLAQNLRFQEILRSAGAAAIAS